jgi:hypothetical protein
MWNSRHKGNQMDQAVIMGMRMGGGLVLIVNEDGVDVFRLRPGMKPDEPLELIGTANREHIAVAAADLMKALDPTSLE